MYDITMTGNSPLVGGKKMLKEQADRLDKIASTLIAADEAKAVTQNLSGMLTKVRQMVDMDIKQASPLKLRAAIKSLMTLLNQYVAIVQKSHPEDARQLDRADKVLDYGDRV